ncbi:MAG: hypothetical protein AAGF10_02630 [Verrucomicrobiota bacterium]
MVHAVRYILTASLLAGIAHGLWAQTAIESITFTDSDLPEGVGNYTTGEAPGGSIDSGLYNFNFGVGASNNKSLISFTANGSTNQIINLADRVGFVREDNDSVSGTRELIWYDADFNSNSGQIDITSSRVDGMATTLLGPVISYGTDNAFANQVGANPNNVERIDYIFETEMAAQDLSIIDPDYVAEGGSFDDQLNFGFTIIERGGNDTFQIAPILEVGAEGTAEEGEATRLGELLMITPSDWGTGLLPTDTIVVRGEPDVVGTEFQPSAYVTGQSLAGVFVSLADLGLDVGDAFRGYALFGGDVDPGVNYSDDPDLYSARLLDTSNQSVYPRTTGSTNGGLDLVSGGVVFNSEGVPTTGFINNPTIPFGVNPVWGLLVFSFYSWRRLRKRLQEKTASDDA